MYTRVPPYPLRVNFDIRRDPLGGYAGVQIFSQPYGLLTNDEVSPPDETALARQFFSPSSEGLETSQLGPTMTGPTRSEGRRGMKLQQVAFIHRRNREFPRRREAPRTPREQ